MLFRKNGLRFRFFGPFSVSYSVSTTNLWLAWLKHIDYVPTIHSKLWGPLQNYTYRHYISYRTVLFNIAGYINLVRASSVLILRGSANINSTVRYLLSGRSESEIQNGTVWYVSPGRT